MFVISEMITKAYDYTLSITNIKAGFECSGIWPLDPNRAIARYALRDDTQVPLENEDGANTEVIEVATVESFFNRHVDLVRALRTHHGTLISDGLVLGTTYETEKTVRY